MPDTEATADRAHGRLDLLADQLEALVGELRAEIRKFTGHPEAPGQDTGGGDDDRGDSDGADQVG